MNFRIGTGRSKKRLCCTGMHLDIGWGTKSMQAACSVFASVFCACVAVNGRNSKKKNTRRMQGNKYRSRIIMPLTYMYHMLVNVIVPDICLTGSQSSQTGVRSTEDMMEDSEEDGQSYQ
jgi:hypothetical protein